MFHELKILYAILIILGLIAIYILSTGFSPKTLIHLGKPGKPQRRIGHLEYEDEHTAGEIRLHGNETDKPIARTAFHDQKEAAIIRILHGEVDDDDNLTDYRMKGYVTAEGYIYRQFTTKEEPVLIGYTAKPSQPDVPTTHGERKWSELWLKSTLACYIGKPVNKEIAPQKEVARCYLDGIAFSRFGSISSEAKACAFALFYGLYTKKQKEDSYYQENSYSDDDVYLSASLIFTLLYLIGLWVCTSIFKVEMVGNNLVKLMLAFTPFYLIKWGLFKYKIHSIEEGHSIQPQLGMINKGVGLKKHDTSIKTIAFLGIIAAIYFQNFDFIPPLAAILIGFRQNGTIKSNYKPWKIISSYQEEEDFEEEEAEDFASTTPPTGEMPKHFTWYLDPTCGTKLQGVLTVNFDTDYITLLREENPFYASTPKTNKQELLSDMIQIATADKRHIERVSYIAKYIVSLCRQERISEIDQLQFTLDFAQEPNIEFRLTKESKSIQFEPHYLRLPDETLFDQEGDYGCKALLAALLLREQGYETLFVASTMKQHAGIAVRIKSGSWTDMLFNSGSSSNRIISYNNRSYLYCETSGDGFKIGQLPADLHEDDFDVKVEMPRKEKNQTTLEEEITI